jgi:hypothetical protein
MWIVILQYLTQAEVAVCFSERVRTSTAADSVVTTDMAAYVIGSHALSRQYYSFYSICL